MALSPDKNGDGSLDMEELKQCLQELQVEYSDQEIEEFHHESDMDASHGIQFKEFIVVLALIYLLGRPTHTGVVSFLVIILLFYLRLFSFLFFLNTAEIYMFTS